MSTDTKSARTIFLDALEYGDADERQRVLDDACAGDDDMRREVMRLLAAHGDLNSFMGRPAAAGLSATIDAPASEQVGAMIGRYKLLEQIGEGGMGVVYVAEQTEPVRRRVALKIIKPGMDTRQVIARFEAERQALAMMDHPNIAKVLDAGTINVDRSLRERNDGSRSEPTTLADLGRPYFVMELIRGMPITEYCDQARLNPRGRLELFMTVCHAVQHAHQKGIIHRDIKPNNVLVTLHDGQPVVKVIDFGVAKATGQQLTERTIYTALTEMIGTPLYMSPEQAELSGLDIDTRSDVYSLGVLLYELLTGQTPFDRETLVKAGLDEVRRMIREDEPPRPSHRISTLNADAGSTVSQKRSIDQRQLTRLLHGELDWITMKALEKDRNRRYESASAFAADIERYLNHEPVEAGPPSALYRFRKFARRRRGVLVAISFIAVSLVAGAGLSLWQAAEAYQERQHAQANYLIARQAVDDMYVQIAEKWLADEPQLEPLQRDFMLKAARFYEKFAEREGDNPQIRFDVAVAYRRCGEVHDKLGEWDQGKAAFDEAVRRLEEILAATPGDARCRAELAKSYFGRAIMVNYVDSRQTIVDGLKALELWRGLYRESPREIENRRALITTAMMVGHELLEHGWGADHKRWRKELEVEAEKLARELLHDSPTALAYRILGQVLQSRAHSESFFAVEESERFSREAISALEKSIELDPRSAVVRYTLGEANRYRANALERLGRKDEALIAAQTATQISERLVDDFPTCFRYRTGLGNAWAMRAIVAKAKKEKIEIQREYLKNAIDSFAKGWVPNDYNNNYLLRSRLTLIELLEQERDEVEIGRQLSAYRKELAKLFRQSRRLPTVSPSPSIVYRLATMSDISNLEMAHVLNIAARSLRIGSIKDILGADPDQAVREPALKFVSRIIDERADSEALAGLSLEPLDEEGKTRVIISVAWLAGAFYNAEHESEATALARFALSRSKALHKSAANRVTLEPALALALDSIEEKFGLTAE